MGQESVSQADLVDLTTAEEPGATDPWEVVEMVVLVVVALVDFVRRKEEEEEGESKTKSEEGVAAVAGSAGESILKRIRRGEYSWVQRS